MQFITNMQKRNLCVCCLQNMRSKDSLESHMHACMYVAYVGFSKVLAG